MRKVLTVLVAVSLLGIAPAQAATKPGSKCTKAGATVNSAGKKFTCIKSSGKLVWNKGVTIKKSSAIKAGVCPPKAAADLDPGITQARANTLIGMSETEAENCANLLDWEFRIAQRDGEDFPGTLDFRLDRVSVVAVNGLITRAMVG